MSVGCECKQTELKEVGGKVMSLAGTILESWCATWPFYFFSFPFYFYHYISCSIRLDVYASELVLSGSSSSLCVSVGMLSWAGLGWVGESLPT